MAKAKKAGATFVRTNEVREPMTGRVVVESVGIVQPTLPEVPANIGAVPAAVAAAVRAAAAPVAEPIGESEAFRQGGALFDAHDNVRESLKWGRAAGIFPRAQLDGETDEAFGEYLEKFAPDEEKSEDYKRGIAHRYCLKYGRSVAYITLGEGKCRQATHDEISAGDARLFRVDDWAAFELPSGRFGALKGHASDGHNSEKGAFSIARNRVKNIADKAFSRALSDSITLDTFGVPKSRQRGGNKTPGERHDKFMESLSKSIENAADRATAIWYRARMRELRDALNERMAAFLDA